MDNQQLTESVGLTEEDIKYLEGQLYEGAWDDALNFVKFRQSEIGQEIRRFQNDRSYRRMKEQELEQELESRGFHAPKTSYASTLWGSAKEFMARLGVKILKASLYLLSPFVKVGPGVRRLDPLDTVLLGVISIAAYVGAWQIAGIFYLIKGGMKVGKEGIGSLSAYLGDRGDPRRQFESRQKRISKALGGEIMQ